MMIYAITLNNWNDPLFWAGITEGSPRAGLDFSALPPNFAVGVFASDGLIEISDGTTTFIIGDDSPASPPDASFGSGTDLSNFIEVMLPDGNSSSNGTGNDDFGEGGDGNDTLAGEGGNDRIEGGFGDDSILGGDGTDTLDGGAGNDVARGGIGADTVRGGDGNDTLEGGDGDDVISGDASEDVIIRNFTNTDNLQESSTNALAGVSAVQLVEVGGRTFLITSERSSGFDGGVGSVEIDADPTSATYGQILGGGTIDTLQDESVGFDNIFNFATLQLDDGRAIVYTADNDQDAIGSVIVDGSGMLTRGQVTVSSNLLNVTDITVVTSGPNAFIIAFGDDTSGTGDGELTVNQIDTATGRLTFVGRVRDEDGSDENFLSHDGTETNGSVVESFTDTAGNAFVIAGGSNNGISLWTLDSSGNLTLEDGRADNRAGVRDEDPQRNDLGRDLIDPASTHLTGVVGATFFEEDGITYVAVGGNDDGISVFRIDDGGGGTFELTLAGQIDDVQTDISAIEVVYVNGDPVLAFGGESQGLKFASIAIDDVTGIVTLTELTGSEIEDEGEGGAETLDVEDITVLGNLIVSASDDDNGVAVVLAPLTIFAEGAGDDSIDGGAGNDFIEGGLGNDTILGGLGADTIAGGEGDDFIDGGEGDDFLTTGEGQDTLLGGQGNDTLMNSDGDDSLDGGTGDDSIVATGGMDTLRGGTGNDFMDGGADADTFIIEDNFGNDTIIGGEGTTDPGDADFDTIDLSAVTGSVTVTFTDAEAGTITDGSDTITFTEIEHVILTDQADSVDASDVLDGVFGDSPGINVDGRGGNDTINGSWGGDTIFGGTGDDVIDADYGDDFVFGGAGADSIQGGIGNDDISGDAGNDTIDGGVEGDTLRGGMGDDSITGGDGDDLFIYTAGDGLDTITDFNENNTGTLSDGDSTNNDSIDLSAFYDNIFDLHADQADDGVLNQSNTTGPDAVDYSGNAQFGPDGGIEFTGASADSSSFTSENTGVVCFTTGTAIRTPRGDVLIDDLRVGDLVTTMDNGPQRIRWIGHRHVTHSELLQNDRLYPVLIKKGVLGAERDLLVSRQHGMLLGPDRLVRATHLAHVLPGVRVARGKQQATYVHLMFEAHQIIFAECIPSESFYPGPMALGALSNACHTELCQLFPELPIALQREGITAAFGDTARVFLENKKAVRSWVRDTNTLFGGIQKKCDMDRAMRRKANRGLIAASKKQGAQGMYRVS